MDLAQLWIPILVSAVIVFIASSIAWMVLPHHKADIKVLPDERALTDHLDKLSIPPGLYMWPNCGSSEEMKSDEFKQRYAKGPWGVLTVIGSRPNFGRNLVLTFLVYLVISVFVAYITSAARGSGAGFMPVFQIAGATAMLGYCAGALPGGIFLGRPVRFMIMDLIDGVVYGLLTGLIFAWLWPGLEVVAA